MPPAAHLLTLEPVGSPEQPLCQPGALGAPLERDDAQRLAQVLKAVAEPARLQLISLIGSSEGGEACVCDLTDALALSQPTVSHHLKVLTEAGLVRREQRGTWAWFTVVHERVTELGSVFTGLAAAGHAGSPRE